MLDLSRLGSVTDLAGGEAWSAGELAAAADARRSQLADAGVGPGQRVVIAHGGTPGFFADLFAVWSAGACAACVDAALTPGELTTIAAFTEAAAVIARPGPAASAVATDCRVLPPAERAGTGEASAPPDVAAEADGAALILFTSGTTGTPKGVVLSFAALAARIALNHEHIPEDVYRRTLCPLPTHFGHGLIGNGLTPLLGGGDLYILSEPGLAGAARLGEIVSQHAISFMSSTPALWRIALKASPPPRPVLRRIAVGSAPVPPALIEAIVAWSGTDDVWNMYGMTETANWAAGGSARERPPEDGLVGRMWGGEAAVRGDDGAIAPHGGGEIVVRTPALMTGYYRRADLTLEAISGGWYRTGDSGEVRRDGLIRLTGRIKDEINRAGAKVMPEEIDRLLERHEAVAEACAFAIPDPVAGEIVGVAVRLEDGAEVAPARLESWCRERIRKTCVPERWFVLPELPRTTRGKLSRSLVRDECLKT